MGDKELVKQLKESKNEVLNYQIEEELLEKAMGGGFGVGRFHVALILTISLLLKN